MVSGPVVSWVVSAFVRCTSVFSISARSLDAAANEAASLVMTAAITDVKLRC